MASIKTPKSTEEESVQENDVKPKRTKRRLYSTDISSPMEYSGHVVRDTLYAFFLSKGAQYKPIKSENQSL